MAFCQQCERRFQIENRKSKIQNLCEDCLVEPGKSNETSEEFDDSAVLPGQMEMTLAMV